MILDVAPMYLVRHPDHDLTYMQEGIVCMSVPMMSLSIAYIAKDLHPNMCFLCSAFAGYQFQLATMHHHTFYPKHRHLFLADQTITGAMHNSYTMQSGFWYFFRPGIM